MQECLKELAFSECVVLSPTFRRDQNKDFKFFVDFRLNF